MDSLLVHIPKAETISDKQAHTRTYYTIGISCSGLKWSTDRTFLEFSALDRQMRVEKADYMKNIKFPNDSLTNRFSQHEINSRKDKLAQYLQEIKENKNLCDSPIFYRFLNLYSHLDFLEEEEVKIDKNQQLAEVMHFFTARTDSELSVEKGDVVVFIEKCGEWSQCQYRGELGFVPANYIKFIDSLPMDYGYNEEEFDEYALEKDKERAPTIPAPIIPFVPSDTEKEERRNNLLDELALRGSGLQYCKDTKQLKVAEEPDKVQSLEDHKDVVAVALFDFSGSGNNELSLKKGDQVIVYSKETSWWQGGRDGKIGYFPGDYVALLDGVTPLEVIASAGPQREADNNALRKEFKEIEEQIKKRIVEQQNLMDEAKRKLSWSKPGTLQYTETFTILEEHRTLHDSLLQNLRNYQQQSKKPNEEQKELSIVDQVKQKIVNHKNEMTKIRTELKHCIPAQRKALQNQLEEQEMLLTALYVNLESLAMYRLQEEEIQKQEKENEMISLLRKRVAMQVMKVEQCRSDLVNCSGSYEDTREVNTALEENITLLKALQANLEALTQNTEQPNINVEPREKNRSNRASVLLTKGLTSFRKSRRGTSVTSPKRDTKTINPTSYSLHRSRAATSFFSPVEAEKPEQQPIAVSVPAIAPNSNPRASLYKPLPPTPGSKSRMSVSQPSVIIPTTEAPKPPTEEPQTGPTRVDGRKPKPLSATNENPANSFKPKKATNSSHRTGAKPSPDAPRSRAKKVSHSTHHVDQVTGNTKKKRAVRLGCAADNEKSVMGSKKKYYCVLCVCENFEASPPPKPENCRNCKHEFSVHRLHRIRSVRMDKNLFSNCIKAQLSFFV